MGFPCICSNLILPKPLAQLIQILCHIIHIVALILSFFGLQSSPELILVDQGNYHLSSFPPAAAANPSFVIKTKLPVVEFSSFVKRSQCGINYKEPKSCVVCLGWLEAKDEVRELGNCDHAFHRECIDRWVDVGHVTCPLCRAQLLPSRKQETIGWIRSVRSW